MMGCPHEKNSDTTHERSATQAYCVQSMLIIGPLCIFKEFGSNSCFESFQKDDLFESMSEDYKDEDCNHTLD